MPGKRASSVRVVLPGGKSLRIDLPNWDGDTRWGHVIDGRGNRIEVFYFDGDPYAEEACLCPPRGDTSDCPVHGEDS